jgi:hypothetical protein
MYSRIILKIKYCYVKLISYVPVMVNSSGVSKMSLRKIIEDRAKYFYKSSSKKRNFLFNIAGEIIVKVFLTDTSECFSVSIKKDTYNIMGCEYKKPNVTVQGNERILIELANTLSSSRYLEAEKNGNLKVIPHGIKGRLLISRVKKLFGME